MNNVYRSQLQRNLADRVWTGMADRGWTQSDLADIAGVSEKHLSRMLTGRDEGSLVMWEHLLHTVNAALDPTTTGGAT